MNTHVQTHTGLAVLDRQQRLLVLELLQALHLMNS
jgi:hypothetical protein